ELPPASPPPHFRPRGLAGEGAAALWPVDPPCRSTNRRGAAIARLAGRPPPYPPIRRVDARRPIPRGMEADPQRPLRHGVRGAETLAASPAGCRRAGARRLRRSRLP